MKERVLHALDLAMLGDWDGAKQSLESLDDPLVARLTALLTEQQRRERERAEVHAVARHELGNAISIAQANMEALVDGVLAPTPERLARIRDAMFTCGVLLDDLKKQSRARRENHARTVSFDLGALVGAQIALVASVAQSKNVRVRYHANGEEPSFLHRGDPDRVALAVRDVLLAGVRYAPPGAAIEVAQPSADAELQLTIALPGEGNGKALGFSVATKLVDALGPQVSVLTENAHERTLTVQLPVVQLMK